MTLPQVAILAGMVTTLTIHIPLQLIAILWGIWFSRRFWIDILRHLDTWSWPSQLRPLYSPVPSILLNDGLTGFGYLEYSSYFEFASSSGEGSVANKWESIHRQPHFTCDGTDWKLWRVGHNFIRYGICNSFTRIMVSSNKYPKLHVQHSKHGRVV